MPDASADKFDLVVRQGTAGLQLRQSERFQAERGLSPPPSSAVRSRR